MPFDAAHVSQGACTLDDTAGISRAMLVVIALLTFVAMEGVAWLTHRFVMHGPLWSLHASHHDPRRDPRALEKNDVFALVFAAPAIATIAVGFFGGVPWLLAAGAGVTAYGLVYAVVHDGLAHARFGRRVKPRSAYLKRLVQAHRRHHATTTKEGAVCFGFLVVPDVARWTQRRHAS